MCSFICNNIKSTILYTIQREISIILHINGSGWHDVETLYSAHPMRGRRERKKNKRSK